MSAPEEEAGQQYIYIYMRKDYSSSIYRSYSFPRISFFMRETIPLFIEYQVGVLDTVELLERG